MLANVCMWHFFCVQSVLQLFKALSIFNVCGGATFLVISSDIISHLGSYQPILRDQAYCILSTLYLMIYLKHMLLCNIWSGFKNFIFEGMLRFSWHSLIIFMTKKLIKSFLSLPPSRRSRTFSPACNMHFQSNDGNEKIPDRFRNS